MVENASCDKDMRDHLLDIYLGLLGHFGPRHWWPADTPFEMITGAILTQNVSWKGAAQAIGNLKERGWLEPGGILRAPEQELAEILRPARYHFQKAQKLKEFCRVLTDEYGGDLTAFLSQETGSLRERLLGIRGIGPETADCIILYAAGKPVFVIDAYTHRIFNRLGYFGERAKYEEMQAFFMRHLPHDAGLFNEYHAQLDALGHHICLKRAPRCGLCPVLSFCKAATAKTREVYTKG
ncbi:MAG: endonuclease III domain-containing protein [Bacillota bacterium]